MGSKVQTGKPPRRTNVPLTAMSLIVLVALLAYGVWVQELILISTAFAGFAAVLAVSFRSDRRIFTLMMGCCLIATAVLGYQVGKDAIETIQKN